MLWKNNCNFTIFANYSTSNALQGFLNTCRVCNIWEFWRFEDSHCARVFNFHRYRGFTYFHKCGQGSEYASGSSYRRFLNISVLAICQVVAFARITQDSDRSEYDWIIPEKTILTVGVFWICLGEVSEGFEYASISLNMF